MLVNESDETKMLGWDEWKREPIRTSLFVGLVEKKSNQHDPHRGRNFLIIYLIMILNRSESDHCLHHFCSRHSPQSKCDCSACLQARATQLVHKRKLFTLKKTSNNVRLLSVGC